MPVPVRQPAQHHSPIDCVASRGSAIHRAEPKHANVAIVNVSFDHLQAETARTQALEAHLRFSPVWLVPFGSIDSPYAHTPICAVDLRPAWFVHLHDEIITVRNAYDLYVVNSSRVSPDHGVADCGGSLTAHLTPPGAAATSPLTAHTHAPPDTPSPPQSVAPQSSTRSADHPDQTRTESKSPESLSHRTGPSDAPTPPPSSPSSIVGAVRDVVGETNTSTSCSTSTVSSMNSRRSR